MIHQIAGNGRLNTFINRCLDCVHPHDRSKFISRFNQLSGAPDKELQSSNTFRELMLGAYLKHCGLKARHSLKIGPKKLTPDWSVVGDKMTVKAIVELYSFHIDAINQNKIDQQLQTRLVATYHPDENISRDDRLYARLCEKADKYQSLAKEFELPYVIAVFCTFEVAMDLNETKVCIFNEQRPFFEKYPEVSGMLHIEESGGTYIFNSIGNLKAQRPLELPNGRLYLSDAKSDLQMDFSSAGPIS